ncbi:MAG: hypothetical protein FJ272_03310 [Planctomycetes bacterium]|nr:hypothetical protein [Planctomycetota bacterium]
MATSNPDVSGGPGPKAGRINLFDLARANAGRLQARYAEAKGGKSDSAAKRIEEFAAYVLANGRISVNMRPSTLADVLHGKALQNMYEHAQEMAALSGREVASVLRERLGEYHDRRLAFEDSFESGRQFRYGALNTGGAGCVKFGIFCILLKPEYAEPEKPLAYVMGDSLTEYTDATGKVDLERLSKDVSTHSHRQYLAAAKHVNVLENVEQHQWAALVCGDSGYIEAIFLETVTCQSFVEVRIQAEEYDKLFRLSFEDFGRKLSEAERALCQCFVTVLRAAQNKAIDLQRV